MWVRWLATVRSPRNSAAATSRFVRPSATRAATRRSAAVRPFLARAPADPSELGARLLGPGGRAERLEAAERGHDRVAGGALLRVRAGGRRRARAARGRGRRGRRRPRAAATACSRSDARLDRRLRRAAATRPRQRVTCASTQLAGEPCRVRLPHVEDAHRVVDPAELEQQLDVVGGPPAHARLAPAELGACRSAFASHVQRGGRVAAPERDEPERPPDAGAGGARTAPRRARGRARECSRASSS